MGSSLPDHGTSLDRLQHEDEVLEELFAQISESRGPTVEDRYAYGNAAKQVVRHVAIRQASLMDVARAIGGIAGLGPVAERMVRRATERRTLIDEVGALSQSVQGISINDGQDFDTPLRSLISAVEEEIRWELTEAIPLITRTLLTEQDPPRLRSSRYVARHAPMRLALSGPKWYERAPIISRVLTLFDHARDHPRAGRDERIA